MKCPKCGCENTEQDLFCTNCGSKLEARVQPKNKDKLIVIFICVALFIGGGIGGYFYMNKVSTTKKFNTLISEADEYLEDLDYDQAIAKYLEAIKIEPKKADPYLKIADIYIIQEDYQSALDILEQAKDNIGDNNKEINNKYDEVSHLLGLVVSGTITDSDGNKLDNVEIQVTSNKTNEVVTTVTTKDGEYSFKVEKGEYTLTITLEGYISQEKTLNVSDDLKDNNYELDSSLSESELKALVEKKGNYLASWQYYDYDFDGKYEAFAVVCDGEDLGYGHANPQVYYINSKGEITNVGTEANCIYDQSDSAESNGSIAFFTFDYGGGGSGWRTEIYGVRNNKPYRLDSSSLCQRFYYSDEYQCFCTTGSDFSNGYHQYPVYELVYNSNTGEFSKGNKLDEG